MVFMVVACYEAENDESPKMPQRSAKNKYAAHFERISPYESRFSFAFAGVGCSIEAATDQDFEI
jgi:hypothetical protein